MKFHHFTGCILLVSGTSIGAGMLALPVVSSFVGLIPSIIVFFVCWCVMLATALFFLDIHCAIKGEINLISMIHNILGPWWRAVGWVVYLLLLYSLAAAYIAASAPLFSSLIVHVFGYSMPNWVSFFALPIIFGGFVYLGTLGVDIVNRILMIGLGLSYLLLIGSLPKYVEGGLLTHIDWLPTPILFPVVITSFGYHIIIPSLVTYMNHDRKKLFWVICIGSFFPLMFYIIWQILILGIVPMQGEKGLVEAWCRGLSATYPLTHIITNIWANIGAQFFSFFAITTSFLGVTLSLSDFLIDGLKIKKSWEGRLIACILTFVPPLIFVFTYQRGFLVALEYAGVFVSILLVFLPAMMVWKLKTIPLYSTILGKMIIITVLLFAACIVVVDILEQWGCLKPLISSYFR